MMRMRKLGWIAGLLLLASAAAQAETLVVPPYPAAVPWKKITDKQSGGQVWIEWIPADQNENDVHDILTEQIFPAQKGTPAGDFVKSLFQRVGGACSGVSVNGPTVQTESGYDAAYGQAYCVGQKGADKDVDIFIKAIAGADALYVVQREFRRPATPGAVAGLQRFAKKDDAETALAAQKIADTYLQSQVKLCADDTGGVCAPAAGAAPPQSDSSAMLGFTDGKSTAGDVRDKMGSPGQMIDGPNSTFEYMYFGQNGAIVVFLFGKDRVLIRALAYAHN
jgi:hypothetical protein